MPTFTFNSEQPYYQNGQLVKKVWTEHNITLTGTDCAVMGWTAARLLGKLAFALLFRRNSYGLPR